MLQPADAGNSEHSPAAEPVNEDWVTLSEIEGRYVTRVLEHTGGNKQAAARVLAVDRKTLDRMIKRHHISSHHARGQRVKVSGRG
jgi:DNA-binding NtrC family response regulator